MKKLPTLKELLKTLNLRELKQEIKLAASYYEQCQLTGLVNIMDYKHKGSE